MRLCPLSKVPSPRWALSIRKFSPANPPITWLIIAIYPPEVDEEVQTLQDHLEAMEEVKLGRA